MRFTIVISRLDPAGRKISEVLIEELGLEETEEEFDGNPIYSAGNVELIAGKRDIIFMDYVQGRAGDVYIFASRHESESGKPCLTVHPTGVFSDDTTHGGREGELSPVQSLFMKRALLLLRRRAEERGLSGEYSVSYEVTHHGPTNMDKPSFFIEIGSKPDNWRDPRAVKLVAEVITELVKSSGKDLEGISSIGFGGPHYAPTFTRKALIMGYALGHMCPKYASHFITIDLVRQMIEKTVPKPEVALIDWKGLRGEIREAVLEYLNEVGVETVRV